MADSLKKIQKQRQTQVVAAMPWLSSRYMVVTLLSVILIFTIAVRFRLRETPLERDEGEYAYAGQLMLQGIPPYKLAYNMKFPGMYVAYAAIMAVFGQSAAGIHFGFALINAGTILLIYFIGARLADRAAGSAAAALYAYGALSWGFVGIAAHATHFVMAFALGGFLLLFQGIGKRSGWRMFFSGVLLGISMLMKQHGALFVGLAGVYLICVFGRTGEWKRLYVSLAMLVSGVALPLLTTAWWLWHAGVFGKFWFWTVQYAQTYAGQYQGIGKAWLQLHENMPKLIWVLLVAAGPALVFLWRKADRLTAIFLSGLLVTSILATIPGFNFMWHYFILPLPALALLAGILFSALGRFCLQRYGNPASMIPFTGLAVALLLAIASERELFFLCSPNRASQLLYGSGYPFVETALVAEYLKQHAGADAQIAVMGSEPQICFYSRHRSATGYIYTYALMEPQPYALRMQDEMIGEVEGAQPEYLVYMNVYSSWGFRQSSNMHIIDWLKKYISGYSVVGALNTDAEKISCYWDGEAAANARGAQILVFKRKS